MSPVPPPASAIGRFPAQLEAPERAQLQQVAEVQRRRRRVEADVGRDAARRRAGREIASSVDLVDQAAEVAVLGERASAQSTRRLAITIMARRRLARESGARARTSATRPVTSSDADRDEQQPADAPAARVGARAQPRRRRRHPVGGERRDEERHAEAEAVDEGEERPAQRRRARRRAASPRIAASVGSDARRPAERRRGTRGPRAADGRARQAVDPRLAVEERRAATTPRRRARARWSRRRRRSRGAARGASQQLPEPAEERAER